MVMVACRSLLRYVKRLIAFYLICKTVEIVLLIVLCYMVLGTRSW